MCISPSTGLQPLFGRATSSGPVLPPIGPPPLPPRPRPSTDWSSWWCGSGGVSVLLLAGSGGVVPLYTRGARRTAAAGGYERNGAAARRVGRAISRCCLRLRRAICSTEFSRLALRARPSGGTSVARESPPLPNDSGSRSYARANGTLSFFDFFFFSPLTADLSRYKFYKNTERDTNITYVLYIKKNIE